eukprot:TRINITY_DN3032_c0_g1_i5.p1 TRINITY_DN3032_c0_g1~~TRINITY_DN3032_c0_g1_i5.p1  ORF type:complete len:219 (-),score=30.03 TRINITY_DN3032_c0_g1_i5:215-871(-)
MMCDGYLLIDSAFLLKKEADIVALEERLNSCKNELSSEIQTIKSSLKAENIEKALKALQLGQTSRKKKHQDLTALHRIKDRLSLAKELSLFERDALESYKDKLNQVYTNLSVAQEDVNNLMQTMDFAKDSINPPASIRREEESLTLIQKMHDLPTEHRLLRNKIFDLPMTEAEVSLVIRNNTSKERRRKNHSPLRFKTSKSVRTPRIMQHSGKISGRT